MFWLQVISMTMTIALAVIGSARKAAIDTSTGTRSSVGSAVSCHRCSPSPAPIDSDGVKMPPGMSAK
ncbi:hypothetical protein GO280_02452 [Ralstonia solanacearum]|nr:hypothetical protein [Ralstonia solanacearum]